MSNNQFLQKLELFTMKNLRLESDLKKLEESGIDLKHSETIKKDEVVDIELFEQDIVNAAKKMANFYVLYYSFENTIRRLISERLTEKYGLGWWDLKVPGAIKDAVKKKQDDERNTVMAIRSEDPIYYTNFGELIDILNATWAEFSDTIRSQKAMQQILSQFNKIRNIIAHSAELSEDDIIRIELLVKDWFRIQI